METIERIFGHVQILETNNYSNFSYFSHNRYCGAETQKLVHEEQKKQFEARVKKMMCLLLDEGFNPALPAICCYIKGELFIMDGQTRVEACKRLNIPFYYMVMNSITNEEEAYKYFFNLNNTGSKWTATDKTISNMFNPMLSAETRAEQEKIVKCARQWGLPISTIKYIAHGQDSNKQKQMTEFNKMSFADDTETILDMAQKIALNSVIGARLFKHDKFIRSVARVYRNPNFTAEHYHKLITSRNIIETRLSKDVAYLSIFEEMLNKHKHTNKIHFSKVNGTLR